MSILDDVEKRSAIPRSMTYLVHHGKVLNGKRTIEENIIGSEEDREKKRKLEETCEGKLTRPSEDVTFLRKEIIDALKRSDEKMESYSRKTDEKMEKLLQKISDSVGAQLHGMNSATVKMKEEDTNKSMKGQKIRKQD